MLKSGENDYCGRGKKMLKLGRYRHYKGNDYQLLGIAKHSESLEELAVYKGLYGDCSLWVRPLAMFEEKVNHNGKIMTRFEFVSAD